MAAKKQLSSDKVGAIVALHQVGKSQREIAKHLEISQSTVNLWVSRHKNGDGSGTPVRKSGSGRVRKTDLRTDTLIKRAVLIKPTVTAKEIKSDHHNLLKDVSVRTIQHRLQKDLGLPSRHAAKKPLLSAKMRKKRVDFCKQHINWTADDWKKVLFSDESSFLTFRSRPRMVRRPHGSDRMDPRYTIKTMKHPSSVMVWGCFSNFGRGSLYFLPKNTTMNGQRYLDMIKDKIPLTMALHQTTTFMHDGAPCHRAKIVSKWLNDSKIGVLDWPGNSPDLNPIENLWDIIKNKVECQDTGSIPKLTAAIKKVWCMDISQETCQNLVKSMPERLKQVIKKKGEMTKY